MVQVDPNALTPDSNALSLLARTVIDGNSNEESTNEQTRTLAGTEALRMEH